ncbi:MAG: radical SAM protein [Candidatus Omnitrophica bacterium]|nr:radical SAM protein [Candidatus Omnitrophota bacterium]
MKLYKKISIAATIIQKRLLGRRMPLLVSWYLTDKCNYQCKYCSIWSRQTEELNTQQVKLIIDKLSRCGTKAIAFSGGEPLLREDIKEILNYCFQKGIYTKLTTNGSLVQEKKEAIKNVNIVKLSFDGPPQIHDFNRQGGSYQQVIKAAEFLKTHNVKVGFNCVMSKLNIEHLDYVLKEAEQLNIKVTFQPLEFRNNKDFILHNAPSKEMYKKALGMLISKKRRGNYAIANSLPGLRYLYNWPSYKNIKCWAGIFHFRITPEGRLLVCDRLENSRSSFFVLQEDIESALKAQEVSACKNGCWRNSTIELNHLLSLHPFSILNVINIF